MSDDLLGGEDTWVSTNELKRRALIREIKYREKVYAKSAINGKLPRDKAYELWIMRKILEEGYQP